MRARTRRIWNTTLVLQRFVNWTGYIQSVRGVYLMCEVCKWKLPLQNPSIVMEGLRKITVKSVRPTGLRDVPNWLPSVLECFTSVCKYAGVQRCFRNSRKRFRREVLLNTEHVEHWTCWTLNTRNIIIIRGATGSDEPWPAEQPPLVVFPRLHQTVLSWHVVSTSNPTAAFSAFQTGPLLLYTSNYSVYPITRLSGPRSRTNALRKILRSARESNPGPLCL
jgi:hypothetical protein